MDSVILYVNDQPCPHWVVPIPGDVAVGSTMATVVANISQGNLRGSKCYTDKGTEYFEFLGIPYAKPPVGDLRFKSPQPPEKWDGIRDATIVSESQFSCQIDLLRHHVIGTEDCLYLSIFSPNLPKANTPPNLLPVMFSIHGGGFLHQNGIKDIGPDYLIDNNVVVVSINYRLGIFGFLSLDMPEASGNMGLKDQVQALIWVQNNIHKFGGDKNNITIIGISAGSASVEYLILSPKSRGLFHKAILQSGSCLNHWAINYEPKKLLPKFLEKLGYEGSTQDYQDIYQYLMSCPPDLLAEKSFLAVHESCPDRLFFGFVPTIEKDFGNGEAFLTATPYKLLREGNFAKVPVIKGFCKKEGYLMNIEKQGAIYDLSKNEDFVRHFAYSLERNDYSKYNAKFRNAYRFTEFDEDIGVDFFGDYDFVSGIWLSGQMMLNHGATVYFYRFSYDGKMNFLKNLFNIKKEGASHADDVSYVFKKEFSKLANDCDIVVRDKITKMWTNFAKSGNPVPTCSHLQPWPAFTQSAPVYLNIDKEFTIESDYEPRRMDVFSEIYDKYQM